MCKAAFKKCFAPISNDSNLLDFTAENDHVAVPSLEIKCSRKMWLFWILLWPYFTHGIPYNQPTASICTHEGFFRYPNDCSRFYRCVDWSQDEFQYSIFHFVCPTGTVFDERVQVSLIIFSL